MADADSKLTLSTPLQFLSGLGPARASLLQKIGLKTAGDLLFCFPRNYELPAPPSPVDQLREGVPASMVGVITDAEIVSRTPGKSMFSAIVENETGAVRILFFNQPFRAEQITFDKKVMISGEPKLKGLRWEIVHPKVTLLEEGSQVDRPEILPIYPLTEGIRQVEMRRWVDQTVKDLAPTLTEVLPGELRDQTTELLRKQEIDLRVPLPSIEKAIRDIHRPKDQSDLAAARARFVFQELFVMQLALAMRRRKLTTDLRSSPFPKSAMLDARIVNRFPFELTSDQKRAMQEISLDMSRQFPMNRMLQGDVGSGKTAVAIYAMLAAVASEHQAVLMAPTEVLARQHYQTLREMLKESRVRVGLLCGSLTAAERKTVLREAADGEVDVLVGTQALTYGMEFDRLGLVVIDEQHKFGVKQRVNLRSGGIDPHYLVMSATPIPRSVAMTIYGDVDLTTLREKPAGRGDVHTYLGRPEWRKRWWDFVRKQLSEGRQAFIVAPRVQASSQPSLTAEGEAVDEDVSSVTSLYQQLSDETFADYRVALLHGGLPNEEKRAVMESFSEGEIDVLITTTVIEVGINVPNATVMTILGAERFGLAQLHQLRGRISRGSHNGHVCVFTDGQQTPEEYERLQVFEQTLDGFELAEADFRMRGPGDVFGSQQSGLPPLRIANVVEDLDVLQVARELAQQLVDEDPELSAQELEALKQQMLRRYGKRLELGDAA